MTLPVASSMLCCRYVQGDRVTMDVICWSTLPVMKTDYGLSLGTAIIQSCLKLCFMKLSFDYTKNETKAHFRIMLEMFQFSEEKPHNSTLQRPCMNRGRLVYILKQSK